MPPESAAYSEDPLSYSSKLDIFSFGVLLLFVVTQEFPKDPLPATYVDANELKPRNELQRRMPYISHAEQVLGDVDHPLLAIVRQCLSNVADRRPTALGILERVSQLRAEVEDDYMERDKLQMIVDLQRLTTECEELQRILYEEDELGVLVAEKERQIGQQEEELRRLNQDLAATQRELHSVQSTVTLREREKAFLEEQLSRVQAEFLWKETELTALRDTLGIQEREESEGIVHQSCKEQQEKPESLAKDWDIAEGQQELRLKVKHYTIL
jgi:serine/threonine protein kinase